MKNVLTQEQLSNIITAIIYYAKSGKDTQVAKDVILEIGKGGGPIDIASELMLIQCSDCLEFFPPFMMSIQTKNRSGRGNICKSCKHFRNLRYKIQRMDPVDGLVEAVRSFMSSVMWDLPQTSKNKQYGKLISQCLRVVKTKETEPDTGYGKNDGSVFWNTRTQPHKVKNKRVETNGKNHTRASKENTK